MAAKDSPFYVDPAPFHREGIMVTQNLSRSLDGLGQVLREKRERRRAQERQAEMQEMAREALRTRNPELMREVAIQSPQMSQLIYNQLGIEDAQQKRELANFSRQILTAPPEQREALYQGRIAMLNEQGRDPSDTVSSYQDYLQNPEQELKDIEFVFSGADPAAYDRYRQVYMGERGLGADSLKSFAPVQIVNPETQEVRLASPTIDPSTGRATLSQFDLPEGFEVAKETPEQKRQAEILAEQQKQRGKREVELELDAPQALARLETGASNLQRLRNEALAIRNDPALERVTGVIGAFKSIPGSAAADVEARIDTLSSQIAFNTLQAMREASKTGGALGQVSERELDLLINNLATLRQSQSPEAFRRSLDQIIEFTEGAEGRLNKTFDRTFGKFVDREAVTETLPEAQTTQRLVFDPATLQLVPK